MQGLIGMTHLLACLLSLDRRSLRTAPWKTELRVGLRGVTGLEGNMNTAKSRSRPLGRDGVSGQGKESKRSVLSWTLPGGLETEETSSHSRPM